IPRLPRSPLFPYTTLFRSGFLFFQFLLEQFAIARLGGERFLLAAQEVVVVARPAGEFRAIQLDDARGELLQEGAVMGDEQYAARSEEHTSELQSRENLVCR